MKLVTPLLILLLILPASCATSNLFKLSKKEQQLKYVGGYDSYLALEYLDLSRDFSNHQDWYASEHFAKKGLASAQMIEVIPENPMAWGYNNTDVGELITAQKRLELVLDPEMKMLIPIQLAHLTMLYDCFVAKGSRPVFDLDQTAKCKVRFYQLLEEVELYIDNFRQNRLSLVDIKEPEFRRYEINFDFNLAKIGEKTTKELSNVITYLTSLNGNYTVILVGKADRVGSRVYNQNLSFRRVSLVYEYLRKNGVNPKTMKIRAYGEDFPDLISADDVMQQLNRVVLIYVIKNFAAVDTIPLPLIENYFYRDKINQLKDSRDLKKKKK